jgi:hypothetical protein
MQVRGKSTRIRKQFRLPGWSAKNQVARDGFIILGLPILVAFAWINLIRKPRWFSLLEMTVKGSARSPNTR